MNKIEIPQNHITPAMARELVVSLAAERESKRLSRAQRQVDDALQCIPDYAAKLGWYEFPIYNLEPEAADALRSAGFTVRNPTNTDVQHYVSWKE
jgi:hypothetical protein